MDITIGSFSIAISPWFLVVLVFVVLLGLYLQRRRKERNKVGKDSVSFEAVSEILGDNSIALLSVRGPILNSASSVPLFARNLASFGDELEKALKQIAGNEKIKGVVVSFDTPGGTIPGSDAIARGIALCRTKKPVYAHIAGMSASGGVMAMVPATKIYAERGALTGSIGVIGPTLFEYTGVTSLGEGLLGDSVRAEKIKAEVLFAGMGKAFGNPHAERDEEAVHSFKEMLARACALFWMHVMAHRAISSEKLDEVGAFILDTYAALELGLIDGTASLIDVKAHLLEELGINEKDCRFVTVKRTTKDTLSLLFSRVAELMFFSRSGNPYACIMRELKNTPMLMLWQGYNE